MSAFLEEKILTVHHWTDRLFSFTTTRDTALRFSNGHFTMIGLPVNGKPLLRAYSIVSANYEEHLEFLSIKVPDGPLTSRLQHIQVGDTLIVGRKPTGTLLIDYLLPGKNLYLLGTGTGLAPYLSIVRDPETYERFDKVIVVHGVRQVNELAYMDYLRQDLPQHELLGEMVSAQLLYYPTVTRESFEHQGRLTDATGSCCAAARKCSKTPRPCSRCVASKKATPPPRETSWWSAPSLSSEFQTRSMTRAMPCPTPMHMVHKA